MGIPLSCFAFCGTVRILEFDARPRKEGSGKLFVLSIDNR